MLCLFGGKCTVSQWCFSCTIKLTEGEGLCTKTGDTEERGKQRKVNSQASVFMLLFEVLDSSAFYAILYTW